MSSSLETIYNRILDVTIAYSIIIYVFTFVIIYYNTPKSMRIFARFMVNFFAWDFAIHIIWAGFRAVPMMPLMCFRHYGFLGYFLESELLGHVMLMLSFLTTVNVSTGIVLSFQFRYFIIKYGKIATPQLQSYAYYYCIIVHILISCAYLVFYRMWMVSVDEYPGTIPPEAKIGLFCFHPNGSFIYAFLIFMAVMVLGFCQFTFLAFMQIHRNRRLIGEKTAKMQKTFLVSLLLLCAVPINFGGIPVLLVFASFHFYDSPYAQSTVAISAMVILNYGPVMCLFSLALFRPYRLVVYCICRRMWKAVNLVPISSQTTSVVMVQRLH